jgi:isoquinoline 1-oxidoreductase subunit beta
LITALTFRGIAMHQSFGSIVAEAVEISIGQDGLRVHRVDCAVDCGVAINPDTIVAQMESGIAYGLTAALYGEITLKGGRVEQANFDSYRMLQLAQMPKIAVSILEGDDKPGGIGEPGTPPIGPALANAIFAATGRRLRSLPVVKSGLNAA